jgi:hypothetical protein
VPAGARGLTRPHQTHLCGGQRSPAGGRHYGKFLPTWNRTGEGQVNSSMDLIYLVDP